MTPLAAYHFVRERKYTLPLTKAHQLEKAYANENWFWQRALMEEKAKVPERFYRETRRNQIFRGFPAKDYRHPTTRANIIETLVNCNNQ